MRPSCFYRAYRRCANSKATWNGAVVSLTIETVSQSPASYLHSSLGCSERNINYSWCFLKHPSDDSCDPSENTGLCYKYGHLRSTAHGKNLILIPTLHGHCFHLFLLWSHLRPALQYLDVNKKEIKSDLSLVERNTICWAFKDHTHYSVQHQLPKSCCLTLTWERDSREHIKILTALEIIFKKHCGSWMMNLL